MVEFPNRLPPQLKLQGLTEEWLLMQLGCKFLPIEVCRREKCPYRVPIHRSFLRQGTPDCVRDLLSPVRLADSGLLHPAAGGCLVSKALGGAGLSETEDVAVAGILSTRLLYQQFVRDCHPSAPTEDERAKIVAQTD